MRFGVFLPSFLTGDPADGHAAAIRAFARRAEELGFDSLWITDHLVTATNTYGVSWLDSLTTLSHVAAVTERVRLGTSILILPTRQPAVLAKEIATLHYLSGGRYVFGVGTGWYEPEFAACGVAKSERGRRTDEVLEATLALFRGPGVRFEGRHYRLDGVTVEPHLPEPPPVWSGGGSQLPHERSVEQPRMHPNVLRRIARADGWIARPTCPPDLIASDLEQIRAARAAAGPFTVAHENFTWIEERGTADEIAAVQRRRFGAVMGGERPWDYLDAVYMTGTVDAIQAKVQARIDAGVEYLMLHTLTADLEQLDLIARHVVAPFSDEMATAAGLVEFRPVDSNHPDARRCIEAYFAELDRRSESGFDPAAGISADPHELRPPAGVLLLAYLRGEAVACGALKHHDDAPSEIKRMWVAESARGLGIGRRLLAELEARARERGARAVRLETNRNLTEAIALYRRAGYVEVPKFNNEPFAHHWFEKSYE